jgi:hypothetical protein
MPTRWRVEYIRTIADETEVAWDGDDVPGAGDLEAILADQHPGEEVEVLAWRPVKK